MKVTVKFLAAHRDITGQAELELELPEGSTISVLLESLIQRYPDLKKMEDETLVSLNKNFVDKDKVIRAGDEVALFPPVSGG